MHLVFFKHDPLTGLIDFNVRLVVMNNDNKVVQGTSDKLIAIGDQTYYQSTRRSTYPFENNYKDKEGVRIRKRINMTVKSTHQSSMHLECSVLKNGLSARKTHSTIDKGLRNILSKSQK